MQDGAISFLNSGSVAEVQILFLRMRLITAPHPPHLRPELKGCTLIIPDVSVGNVGQLAMDLIIETLAAELVGQLMEGDFGEDFSLLPCVGSTSFSHLQGTGPSFPLELFMTNSTGSPLYLLQQRSSPAPGLQGAFAASLVDWAQSQGVHEIWTLGSLDGRFRRDSQLSGSQLRFYADGKQRDACLHADILPLEEDWFADLPLERRLLPPWPLQKACKSREAVACASILIFALEGNNVPEAHSLADAAVAAVPELKSRFEEVKHPQWRCPPSWVHLGLV